MKTQDTTTSQVSYAKVANFLIASFNQVCLSTKKTTQPVSLNNF